MPSLRLKHPGQFPPGGFQFRQPEIGWTAPNPLSENMEVLAARIRQLRLNNDVLKRANLPTETWLIKQEIVDYLCAQNPKLCVVVSDGAVSSASTQEPQPASCCGGRR